MQILGFHQWEFVTACNPNRHQIRALPTRVCGRAITRPLLFAMLRLFESSLPAGPLLQFSEK
ncbi:unnamed protein product [Leuciscus chuanchicus]